MMDQSLALQTGRSLKELYAPVPVRGKVGSQARATGKEKVRGQFRTKSTSKPRRGQSRPPLPGIIWTLRNGRNARLSGVGDTEMEFWKINPRGEALVS